MASQPARRPATYEDVLRAPEHMIAEVVDGELHLQPRPALEHAATSAVLGELLGPPFRRGRGGPGGWILLYEPELHFGADVLVPDFAGWRRERLPHVPDGPYLTVAPDWVCEILSPRTARTDRMHKLPIYAREHVAHAWLIDPAQRTLEVFRREGSQWLLLGVYTEGSLTRAEPFEALAFDLGELWADVAQPSPEDVEPR